MNFIAVDSDLERPERFLTAYRSFVPLASEELAAAALFVDLHRALGLRPASAGPVDPARRSMLS